MNTMDKNASQDIMDIINKLQESNDSIHMECMAQAAAIDAVKEIMLDLDLWDYQPASQDNVEDEDEWLQVGQDSMLGYSPSEHDFIEEPKSIKVPFKPSYTPIY